MYIAASSSSSKQQFDEAWLRFESAILPLKCGIFVPCSTESADFWIIALLKAQNA
jgi:hypothetical protein